MLHFTEQEKSEWAAILRAPGVLTSDLPEGYMDVLDQVQREELEIPARDGHLIRAWKVRTEETPENSMLYINIHGGGFVQPHSDFDHALCAIMAKEFSCTVIDIDYRLAPEHPYPAGMNDCIDTVRWIYAHTDELGVDKNRIVMGGNSAGGTFCADVCMRLAQEGHPLPNLVIMVYPAANLNENTDSADLSSLDLSDVRNRGLIYDNLYLTSEEQLSDPYINLIRATPEMLKGFPDTVVITGGRDPLAPGGEEFAKMLAVSGSRITVRRFLNSGHGFYVRCSGDWKEARNMVFEEIRRAVCR